jgi:DNA-binding beta-propeller fold protein YncE
MKIEMPVMPKRFIPLILLLVGSLLLLISPDQAHADGGAPNLAYVAGSSAGIGIVDIASQKISGSFSLPGNPGAVYLSLDGRFLYVAQPGLNQVSMLAAKTGQVDCTGKLAFAPTVLSYDPQTATLFVAGKTSTTISQLNMSTCAIMHTWQAPGTVSGLAVVNLGSDTENNQLWVSSGSKLVLYDTKTYAQLDTVTLPDNPHTLVAPAGLWIYAATQHGNFYAIGLSDHNVEQLLSGGQFGNLDYDDATGQIFVPDALHNRLDVVTPPDSTSSTLPKEPAFTYDLPAAPQAVAVTSGGQFAFAALSTGQVVMFDLAAHSTLATINVGGSPHAIITGLYPPALGTTPQSANIAQTVASIVAYALLAGCVLMPVWFMYRRGKKTNRKQAGEG